VDTLLQGLCDELIRGYGAHTVLLYGSRADNSANEFSDYDIAAFAKISAATRDARVVDGQFVDVFIHPEEALVAATEEHLSLRGSKILLQRGNEAAKFLTELDAIFARGPKPLPADEIQARRVWARKMALRMRRADIEGNYRRAWLLTALLEDYFCIRGMWYQGPKKSIEWLLASDPETHNAFATALQPGASDESIDVLTERVVGDDKSHVQFSGRCRCTP
jgi:hypothetical protein